MKTSIIQHWESNSQNYLVEKKAEVFGWGTVRDSDSGLQPALVYPACYIRPPCNIMSRVYIKYYTYTLTIALFSICE